MTDSVDTIYLDDHTDEAAVQTALSDWLANNAVTSIDHTDLTRLTRRRALVIIWYTA
ncbi:hypothetical protein Hbl1158_10140 [Halobaculum sp. CBA1158]|uniref:hypothetical protein n=1 Tax=Halobaculum sp. CBA1158 TaxID=2904243 RepID=UPI001F30803B|nr:hypothetical protein [Halobaculum sp. CBA1158]UIO98893.1 hypothetical protein Hbl1158_10140 [Halobaculum sp. CBA1158]